MDSLRALIILEPILRSSTQDGTSPQRAIRSRRSRESSWSCSVTIGTSRMGATLKLGGDMHPSTSSASKWPNKSLAGFAITYLPHMRSLFPMAGTCWAEASSIANEQHTAAEAAWAQEKKNLNLEVTELIAALDRVSAEKDSAVAELAPRSPRWKAS